MGKKYDNKLDQLIHDSMEITDNPSKELNNSIKRSLYKNEAMIRRGSSGRNIPLWYAPMILNFLTFSLLALFALIIITNPYLSVFAAVLCCYISVAGVLITLIGVKRTKIKEELFLAVGKEVY